MNRDYSRFVKEKAEVKESDKKSVFGQAPRPDFPDADRVILAGLPGSGRRELAQRLGLTMIAIDAPDDISLIPESGGYVAVLSDAALEDDILEQVKKAGRVFYLMTDAGTLASRATEGGEPEFVREDLSIRLVRAEPLFMQVLHFILPSTGDFDQMESGLRERLGF